MMHLENLTPIDLTRATPPCTAEVSAIISDVLRELSHKDNLHQLLRSNRIGGSDRDCYAASGWLGRRLSFEPSTERIVVGNGTQNLLSMALKNTVGANRVLLAEELTHPLVPPIAGDLGISVVPVAIDSDGLVPEALDAAFRKFPDAPVYINPTGHNPTTTVMSAERRRDIVSITTRHGRYIIEDDVLGSLRRSGPLPVASFGPERVWYIQTLSKCIGLGLRVAYLVLPEGRTREQIVAPVGMRSSWFPGVLPVEVVDSLFETGRFWDVSSSVEATIERRRAMAVAELENYDLRTSQGALHSWLNLPAPLTSRGLSEACRAMGVLVRPGDLFVASSETTNIQARSCIRIALTAPASDDEFQTGLVRLKAVLAEQVTARSGAGGVNVSSPTIDQEVEIRRVRLEDVVPVRKDILRPHEDASVTITAVDRKQETVHFAAFVGEAIVGVASSGPEASPFDSGLVGWRLRGLAVYPQYRRRGVASALLKSLKDYLRTTDCEIWWAYARSAALSTYERVGFARHGDDFDMPPTGLHTVIVMNVPEMFMAPSSGYGPSRKGGNGTVRTEAN